MKKVIVMFLFVLLAGSFGISFTKAAVTSFERDLKRGSNGQDVQKMQQILNEDVDTQVADSGVGSSGKETTYFGAKTKTALIKFQTKHNLGEYVRGRLTYTGELSGKTREFFNRLLQRTSAYNCDRTVSSSRGLFATGSSTEDKISKLNKILDPKNLTASLEDKTEAINNIFKADAGNTSTSTPFIRKVEFVGGNTFIFDPTKSKIKIIGCAFSTSTDNTVHMTFNDQKVRSDDGKTLEFEMKSSLADMFKEMIKNDSPEDQLKAADGMPNAPMFITVENRGGISNPYQIFFKFSN